MGDMNGTSKRDMKAKPKAKEDQQAVKLVNKSDPETRNSTESLVVLCRNHNVSRGLSFSKLEVALMIAVAILAILLAVFFALYCTAVRKGKAHGCPSCLELVEYKARGNESRNFTDGRHGEFPVNSGDRKLDDRKKTDTRIHGTDTRMEVTESKKNGKNIPAVLKSCICPNSSTAVNCDEPKKEQTFVTITKAHVGSWMFIGHVCVGGKDLEFKEIKYTGPSSFIGAIKLVHTNGYIACGTYGRGSRWGCKRHDSSIGMIITDTKRRVIYPSPRLIKLRPGGWYTLPGYTSSSQELVLVDFAHPKYLMQNETLKIWYGEDLYDYTELNNRGFTCMDVHAYPMAFDVIPQCPVTTCATPKKSAMMSPQKPTKKPTPKINDTVSCNFDRGTICSYSYLPGKFNWTLNTGASYSTGTGPSSDVSGKGYYLYIEASLPRIQGDYARITTPSLSAPHCLTFWYHMLGNGNGMLNVYVNEQLVYFLSSNTGVNWKKKEISISEPGSYKVMFEGVVGLSYESDISIDNITFVPGSCSGGLEPPPPPPGSWEKIGSGCVGAKNNHYSTITHYGSPFFVGALKLVHKRGGVSCRKDSFSNWGCSGKELNMIVTDARNEMIYPAEHLVKIGRDGWYTMPGFTSTSPELVFTNFAFPRYLRNGETMRIWYGEDFHGGRTEDGNYGVTCMDVYAYRMGV